jgi:hypothetical protein
MIESSLEYARSASVEVPGRIVVIIPAARLITVRPFVCRDSILELSGNTYGWPKAFDTATS